MNKSDMRRVGLKDEVIRIHFQNPSATIAEIAGALSVRAEYVRSTFRRNGLTPVRKMTVREKNPSIPPVLFPKKVADRLRPYADRRGITVEKLVATLLNTIAADQMVDAILDDMETAA